MAKHKSLIISHRFVRAGKLRHCHHNRKHAMTKGAFCFEVREGMKWKGYCRDCATEMLVEAEKAVGEIKGEFAASRI
jgi:hypothetical protein